MNAHRESSPQSVPQRYVRAQPKSAEEYEALHAEAAAKYGLSAKLEAVCVLAVKRSFTEPSILVSYDELSETG